MQRLGRSQPRNHKGCPYTALPMFITMTDTKLPLECPIEICVNHRDH